MVDFPQILAAKPELWTAASKAWSKLAEQAEKAANDIYNRGTGPLNENWPDRVGSLAGANLKKVGESYLVAAASIHGVVSTLDSMGESVGTVQRSLRSAVDYATRQGFAVDGNGHVTHHGPLVRDGDEERIRQTNALITEAIESATKIDEMASSDLDKLAAAVTVTDRWEARDKVQQEASENALKLLRESLPLGKDPATVEAWWNSLTPEQRADYERATPVDLYDLQGIPEDVKQRLRGTDGYNRVEMIRWAQNNVNNSSIDIYGDSSCTNYVSEALKNSGLAPKAGNYAGDSGWAHPSLTGWNLLDTHTGTSSWAGATAQRDFFLANGGQEIPQNQAQPGDIVYWEQVGAGAANAPGEVHHAAIVSAVTPDGDIHYTQHSDSRLNASLNGRLPASEVLEGDQRVIVVRPKQTW